MIFFFCSETEEAYVTNTDFPKRKAKAKGRKTSSKGKKAAKTLQGRMFTHNQKGTEKPQRTAQDID